MRRSQAQVPVRSEGIPQGSSGPALPEPGGGDSPWRTAWRVLVSSVLFPGNGHLRIGQYFAGTVWTVVFAAAFFPAAICAFIIGSPFLGSAILWFLVSLFSFGVACGSMPALSVLRTSSRPAARREPPRWLVGFHASFLVLVCLLEMACFLGHSIGLATVRTSSLEPALSRGDAATVIVSRYVRPVHGNIVLFRRGAGSPSEDPAGAGAPRLGRVLAKPEDSVEARKGLLLVNGVEFDPGSMDQRKILEKAGRSEKRRRMFSVLHYLSGGRRAPESALPGTLLAWETQDWGPQVLPRGVYLVLPDMEAEDLLESFSSTKMPSLPGKASLGGTPPGNDRARTGLFVFRSDILGRVVE